MIEMEEMMAKLKGMGIPTHHYYRLEIGRIVRVLGVDRGCQNMRICVCVESQVAWAAA